MDFKQQEPVDLHTTRTFRDARAEGRKKDLGAIDIPKKPLDLLIYLQSKHTCIRQLVLNPVTLIYQLDEQRELYKLLYSKQRIKVESDATGGLIKTLEIFPGVSINYIYYYNIVLKIDGWSKITAISQMISSKHDASVICEFFELSFPDDNYPQEFVSDGSAAVENGASLAIT